MKIKIKKILAQEAYELRHPLLRKGQPFETCRLENDDHPETLHIGAFVSSQLVGILSAFPNPCPERKAQNAFQLRAMAVLPEFQRKKIATQLIQNILLRIKQKSTVQIIWLNARINANELYLNNGFKKLGTPFEIKPIGMHQRFLRNIPNES